MATYTRGYKKQSGEQILLKTIVGIIVTVMLVVLAVFIYDVATDQPAYSDFKAITKYNEILTQKQNETQIQDYIIYFYNDTCSACNTIKDEALKLAREIEKNGTKVFLVNTANITEATAGDRDAFLNAINESSIRTPMVVVVADGVFYRTYIAAEPVVTLLTTIKNKTYEPYN